MKQIAINFVPSLGLTPVVLQETDPGDTVGNAPHMYRETNGSCEIRVNVAWRIWKNRKTYIFPLQNILSLDLED